MSNQLPPSIRKVNASQLGRFTRLSLSICGTRDVVDEAVVHPGGIGARVVHLPGLRFRRGAPGGEVAVSQRAQRLTKLLALRVVPLKGVLPSLGSRDLVLVGQPLRSALDELAHLIGTLQG